MTAVVGSMDSPLFELRNFRLNEALFRERNHNKMKPGHGRAGSPGRMSPRSRRGMSCETQVKVAMPPGRENSTSTSPSYSPGSRSPTVAVALESQVSSPGTTGGTNSRSSSRPRHTQSLNSKSLGGGGGGGLASSSRDLKPGVAARSGPLIATKSDSALFVESNSRETHDRKVLVNNTHHSVSDDNSKVNVRESCSNAGEKRRLSLEETDLQKLAKMLARELCEDVRRPTTLPIQIDDFTGAKTPYLAEDAMVWLKKLRLAAQQNDWTESQTLDVASIHLKGLAARWFVSIGKDLKEAFHDDKERWQYFQAQFEERFADYRSRLLQIEKIKGMRLREGEDVREYAEGVISMNFRLDDPLDEEFLGWVFVQGLPPSELRDKLYQFMETPGSTLTGAISYARRFQLSQTVFSIKDSIRRPSPGSSPARSVSRS